MNLLLALDPSSLWNGENGSTGLWIKIILALLVTSGGVFALARAPAQVRKPVIVAVTFLSGLYYVLFWLFPQPINRSTPSDAPRNMLEAASFWISDAQNIVANISNIIAGFLIGLGIYSLLRIHLRKIVKKQTDWGFSAVLVVSLVAMTLFGYWDWANRQSPAGGTIPFVPSSAWGFQQYARDLLFDGLLQQMDAGMFSVVAFYIMSAAYRAFRARSIEATILLITALIVMLSFMGVIQKPWDDFVAGTLAGGNKDSVLNGLKLSDTYTWIRGSIQTPAIRGIDFGVGVGLLAMGLRIWLSLEKTGGND